jgi:NAD(P)-dependent dehydrogenase (short-subunit alcohol dehydrogenase family)
VGCILNTNPLILDGKRALVLGAGSPVGRAIAVALAEAGADVAVAAASLDGEEVMACRRARRAIEALGRRSTEYAFDVTLGQNVQVSTRQVAKEMGGLDILVYAVAQPLERPVEKTTDAEWTRTLAVNLGGAFFACRAAVREMHSGGGRIILVLTDLAERGLENTAAVVAAQHGVIGLARALALELGGRGIRVNAIAAGRLDGGTGAGEHGEQNLLMRSVLMRRLERSDDVGGLAVYLASDASDDMTGQVVLADGGAGQPR